MKAVIKQKKIIELPMGVVRLLDLTAKADGRSTKNLIERIIIGHVNENILRTAAPKISSPKK